MKKIAILLILIIFYASNTWAQKIEAQVKEEVELMSVLARLAGYEEYGSIMREDIRPTSIPFWENSVRMKPWK